MPCAWVPDRQRRQQQRQFPLFDYLLLLLCAEVGSQLDAHDAHDAHDAQVNGRVTRGTWRCFVWS